MNNQEQRKNKTTTLQNVNYKKSNLLISGKYRSSLTENKILALGMSKAKFEGGRAIAVLTAAELKNILCKNKNNKSGSFYTKLKDVALEMTGRKLFVEDENNKSFAVINLVGSATYKDNLFTIKFEPDITDYLISLKSNYTNLNLSILMSFDKIYSYRLYELLKSQAYSMSGNIESYSAEYGLSELKLAIGVVDTNSEVVSRALKKPNPDFDYIVNNVSKDKNFSVWSDFKKCVIDVAIDEINEKSDLNVSYDLVREGYGGRVTKIIFNFYKKAKRDYLLLSEPDNDDVLDMIDDIIDYIDFPIKAKDVKTLIVESSYNVAMIKKLYDLSKTQDNITNFMGWMLSAINNDYIKD